MESIKEKNEYLTTFMRHDMSFNKHHSYIEKQNLSEFVAKSQIQQQRHEMSLIKDLFGGKSDSEDELKKEIDYDLKDNNDHNLEADTSEWEEEWLGVERPEGKSSGTDSNEDNSDDDDHDGGEMMPIMTSF